ncbi:uncharacterized protein C1orf105 homolog isoform X2 [Tupaia chinensis]|uniref:uncharacterized protein C1orf105 homolog isoform X2 n=1 Tax=Tupaia chinensis TaxID=246437 RepID=UPI000FFBFD9C|nr:uncharacterized protein C1orf105 homolog isoform X2 [Tupaia chinensis]
MEKRELKASVPKFDKVPWLSKASLENKPLLLSLPKRSPHCTPTFLTAYKKNMNLPMWGQVPDVLRKGRRNQNNLTHLRNKQLCSTCRELKTVQPRPVMIPRDLKLSYENFMSHRTMSHYQPEVQTVPRPSRDNILAESIQYRLPILGPRTAVFQGVLADAYKTLQEMQHSSYPRKEPMDRTMKQRVVQFHHLPHPQREDALPSQSS